MTDNQTQAQPAERSNAELIWDTCVDLHNAGRIISRKVLVEITCLKTAVVDVHVETLVDNDKLRRLGAGMLEVVIQYPPARATSVTELPDGFVKLEVGDVCLHLQPTEARRVSRQMLGYASQLAESDATSRALERCAELSRQIFDLRRQIGPRGSAA